MTTTEAFPHAPETIAAELVTNMPEFGLHAMPGYARIAITHRLDLVLTTDVFNSTLILWELTGHIGDGRLASQRADVVAGELPADPVAALAQVTNLCQVWADR
ncbi:hypothetical protein [Nocardia sp. NPDC058480]|uniref:hypothetical protein n=1 Tax=Nocardia sp. NPDC058480 TaxID=3346522 RepID=UPI00365AB07C